MTTDIHTGRGRWIAAAAVLVLAGAIAAVVYNQRLTREITQNYYIPRAAKITPEVALLQQYVRINSSNPPGDETATARWLADQLARAGVHAEIIESAPRRVNVYARIRGSKPGDGLVLLNHMDVVPAAPKWWHKPPFSGSIAANMLYGRGAADMKGIGICHLQAFVGVAQSRRTPEHDLVFLAVADEENGSEYGTQWLLQHRPDVFAGAKYVLAEGGITEVQKEALTYFGVEVGAKEMTDVWLVAPTREQMQQTRLKLEPYFHPPDPDRVLPGVRDFFRSVAPRRVQYEPLFADVDKTIRDGKFWLLPETYRDLLQNTIWAAGVAEANGHFTLRVVMLNLPGENPDERIAWLRDLIASTGASIDRIDRKEGPIPMSPDDTPLFTLLVRDARRVYNGAAAGPEVLAAATSDSRFLRPLGFVCYGFQPFPLDYFQTLGVHGVDERVRLDWFVTGVQLTTQVVGDYLFPPQKQAEPHS